MFDSVAASVVFLLLISFINIDGWRPFTISLSNSTWAVHSNKVNLNVTVNKDTFNMHYTVKEQITHPAARVEIFMQSLDSGRYDMELVNRTIDLCKFFENNLYEPLVQIIYKLILEHGNFIKSCPVKQNKYYVENMYLDAERFPPYLPERKGYVNMFYVSIENNLPVPLAESKVYFEIKNSAMNRFKGIKPKKFKSLFRTADEVLFFKFINLFVSFAIFYLVLVLFFQQ